MLFKISQNLSKWFFQGYLPVYPKTLWRFSEISTNHSLTHQWRYKFNKPSDHITVCQTRFFFSKTFYTWMLMIIPRSHRPGFFKPCLWEVVWSVTFRVENVFGKKNEKDPMCETIVWSLVDRVKNLIEKKWPGLSDSDMATGGLNLS